ncbi:unnamed protein product [Polarella glacialis]|uniref:Uncharacterized protein n=1 Tax=Polarella glacialis TaxID=89957 RepID=A0A813D6D2_POLGL|nr:unnamed protein product [Polarella glacialis]
MKKKYLNLEFCNGVPLRALRTNSIDSLNLASFHSHHGMYGIEVVGAIFLAHFLRLNSSLTYLNFKRNDIEKDGAKALAQSLLGNPQCVLRTVNTMGEAKNKPGIDFSLFRTGQLTTVNLSKRLIDDDDFVFLEEWLRRYDCVTDLDISWNLLSKDGVRKLTRYVKESRTLVNLNCVGLPVNIEGSSLICRAVVENQTLRKVGLPLGPADDHPDRQQMLQQLGVGLANHPTLQSFASNRTPNLDYTLLAEVRENKVRVFPPERSSGWPKVQMQAYMWFLTAVKPDLDQLSFGGSGKPKVEYPKDAATSASKELWGPLLGIVHDVNRSLQHVSIAFPPGCTRGMEMMRVLTRCSQVRTLKLLAYASVPLKDSQLPTEWSSVGGAPRWLVEDRLKHRRTHWQALHGLLGALPQLEQFNDIVLGGMNMREQPELVCLLLMQCLEGVAVDLQEPPGGGAEAVLKSRLSAEADVDNFCDVLRLLSRTPLLIDLQFTDKRVQMVKAQQSRLAPALSGVGAGEGSPRFTHAVALRNNQVSETLLEALHCEAPLREFCYENIEGVLPALFAALCGKEKPLPIERIRVEPKWLQSRMSCKRFGDRQRRWLDGIQAALIRSDRFVELKSASAGTVSRSAIAAMSLQEFANVMTGISAEDMPEAERHPPQIPWRCFPSWRAFESPPDPHAMVPPLLVPLPMDEEVRAQLQLRKLSLCMCDMRPRLTRSARPDEWPEPSGPLWHGRRRFIRPGDWHEYEQVGEDGEDEDDGRHVRYHWQEHLRIGTQSACSMVSQVLDPNEPPFADSLLHEGLRSLLAEDSSLRWLDLRGNGLTREDANLVLSLVESHQSLESLNMIPVLESEAMACQSLEIDGTGMKKPEKKEADEDDPYGNDDEEDPPDEAYAREVFETEFVRMDEGDGYIFLQLVAPNFFPELKHVLLRKLEIPQDSTLAHITDALLNLQSVEQLRLSDLRLSSRGSSLLLQAVAELAPRLSSLNGLPLARLMQMRDSRDGGMLELPGNIEWNDFPLGAMARLNLWQVASFPPSQHGDAGELQLQGQSLTDVGLRGLCVMLRHFAGQDRIPMGPSLRGGAGTLNLTRIDLSGNPQITDATVADLCHTLQHPSMGGGLRHGLRELSVRSCMRLKTRSAYELLNFVQHVREATRESSANSLGNSLQLVNGVDLEALYTAGRATSGVNGARVSGPPMLLRCIVDLGDGGYSGRARSGLSLTSMSECDTHFLAGVLHQFPSIPYCHLHLVVPASLLAASTSPADKLDSFGRQQNLQGEGGTLMHRMEASNDSPFPQPVAGGRAEASLNAQLESARRFFEACPTPDGSFSFWKLQLTALLPKNTKTT